jgi:hypothetical protein
MRRASTNDKELRNSGSAEAKRVCAIAACVASIIATIGKPDQTDMNQGWIEISFCPRARQLLQIAAAFRTSARTHDWKSPLPDGGISLAEGR